MAYFCCEASANSSACSRVMPKSSATLSPVSGIWWLPYCFTTFGLGKREPMVVSNIFTSRLKGVSDLPITYGARLMLSTPPAT